MAPADCQSATQQVANLRYDQTVTGAYRATTCRKWYEYFALKNNNENPA
jgi:hypothetical protein